MRQLPSSLRAGFLAALAVLLIAGCGPRHQDPVAEARHSYTVRLSSFRILAEPDGEDDPWSFEEDGEASSDVEPGGETAATAEAAAAEVAGMEGDEIEAVGIEEDAEGEAEGEEGEEGDELPEGPRTPTVLFDLIIRFEGEEALPGITVDVEQQDPFGALKQEARVWVDTAGMEKGEMRIVPTKLEVPEFEEGDEFSVMLRSMVPPEERGDYREFSESGG